MKLRTPDYVCMHFCLCVCARVCVSVSLCVIDICIYLHQSNAFFFLFESVFEYRRTSTYACLSVQPIVCFIFM